MYCSNRAKCTYGGGLKAFKTALVTLPEGLWAYHHGGYLMTGFTSGVDDDSYRDSHPYY